MKKITQKKKKIKVKKPETYLDFLMRNCQFQEFRWKREFTEFCISKFVPKLESKCLEIKNKYDFNGQSLTLEKWLDICTAENVFPLTDEEAGEVAETTNGFHATCDNGTKAIWVRGTLSLEEALQVAAHELAHHILNHSGLPFDKDTEQTGSVEDYLDYPEHLQNEIEADVLGAMLLAETI
jgi:hypothetical protein